MKARLAAIFWGRRVPSRMHRVTLYTRAGCHLCEDARATLMRVQTTLPFAYEEIDIATDDALLERYGEKIPVVAIDGVDRFWYRVNERRLVKEVSR